MSETIGKIIGTGSYVPTKVVSNEDLAKMVETSDEWIGTRTGIRERRVVTGETASDMAVKAAKEALKSAEIDLSEIDLVVTGTVTPDMVFPSVSCLIQSKLGLKSGIAAFDVSAACSGFLYALDVADKYIKGGMAKKALVVGVDVFSKIVDWGDRSTCVLFGDGAGAVVLSASKGKSGVLSSHVHSDGKYWEMLYTPGSLNKTPFEHAHHTQHKPYVRMKGNEVFKLAVRTMNEAIKEALDTAGLKPEDITLLIPHQANIRIIEAMKDRLNMGDDKVYSNISRYGNTSAGSIPIALDEAVREGRIKKGDIVVFVAFGGGLTWASSAVRW